MPGAVVTADPNAPTRLRFDGTINIPSALALVALLLTGGTAWNTLTNRVTKIEESQSAGFIRGQSRDVAINALNVAVHALEIREGRSDERFNAILTAIQRLEEQLREQTGAPP